MDDANPAALRLAEVTIGAVRVGIPADAVVQAIPVPDAPVLLPRRGNALCGIVDYEGMLVPVVDLARWVDVGTAPPAFGAHTPARTLVLRAASDQGMRVIGLQVDGVGGLADIPLEAITRLHHDDDAEEVFHSAARSPESGQILSLLDVGRLAALADAWSDAGMAAPACSSA